MLLHTPNLLLCPPNHPVSSWVFCKILTLIPICYTMACALTLADRCPPQAPPAPRITPSISPHHKVTNQNTCTDLFPASPVETGRFLGQD